MKFRYHRGSLTDSLETAITFFILGELKTDICTKHSMILREPVDLYMCYYGYDKRVDQKLWLVRIEDYPIGFVYDLPDEVAKNYSLEDEFIWDEI